MKIKELTLEKIIELSKKYSQNCTRCPLYSIPEIECYNFCELSREKQVVIECSLEQEIEVD